MPRGRKKGGRGVVRHDHPVRGEHEDRLPSRKMVLNPAQTGLLESYRADERWNAA
jgi:hypothetical protein